MEGNFVPWLYAIGAQVRQVSAHDMAFDPAVMASAVVDTAKLFSLPILCAGFDLTLWAEAAGCTTDWDAPIPQSVAGGSPDPNPDTVRESERITTLVEAIPRIKGAITDRPLACAITGPATLCQLLELDPSSRMDQFTVGELITEFVTVLCENDVDNVVIVEAGQNDPALAPWVSGKQYSRIAKLANHYNKATTVLCAQASLTEEQVAEFDQLTYVVADPDTTIAADLQNAIKGVAVADFGTGAASMPEGIDQLTANSYFLTTAGDVDAGCTIEDIQADIATVS